MLVNGFGPTESTVSLQCFVDAAAVLDRSSVPVGRPVERTAVTLLSREGRPGQVFGEITIRSRHLAVGYWRQPELTESVFLPDPSGGKERLYRTGDLGRFLPDGSLEYRGRRDLQVKIHGFRVELGEIEAALAQHPGVAAAAAAAWEPKGGEKAIAGYFVSARDPAPSSDDLRRFLRERLPAHMLPSRFVRLEALPQTPSGKLDRRALPAPAEAAPEREAPAPRDQLEESLLAIWKEVLADATLGTRDDFFDRGGHSLLALQVVAAIESRLQISLPLSALAEAPTVERLAERLRSGGALTVRSLVAMQPRGKRPPLFCVHGHSGEVLFYRELSGRLGAEQPFYGLQSSPDSEPPPRSVEEMAAAYLAAIRAVQPRGPYFIGGYCLGAVVAFEMAQQLIAAGDEVALLALFWGPARRPPLLERIRLHLRELQRLGFWAGTSYLIERAQGGETARAAASRLWQFAYLIDGLLGGWASQRLLRNRPELALHAARSYRPRPYPGRMTVFASGGVGPSCHSDPEAHLAGMIAAEMSVIEVPGDRDSMMREPLVQVIAEQLEGAISRAR